MHSCTTLCPGVGGGVGGMVIVGVENKLCSNIYIWIHQPPPSPMPIPKSYEFGLILLVGSFGLSTKVHYTIMFCLSCIVVALLGCWHWCHLCTPPLATGLDIDVSYLVHICTYAPIYVYQIFSDSDL